MKSKHKVERFDYSKYNSNPHYESLDHIKEYEYWGLHPVKGHIHVDTKRFIKMCKFFSCEEYIHPEMNENRDTPYLIPAKKKRDDYAVNLFLGLFNYLEYDWLNEYQPLFKAIKTPESVELKTKISLISGTCCAADMDEINEKATIAKAKRMFDYERIYQSVYCQFIQKLCTETERYILIVMKSLGFKGNDYSYKEFVSFSDALLINSKDKNKIKVEYLKCYDKFNLLRKINNFLKHNSVQSYEKLKTYYPDYVYSKDNKSSFTDYENGMFAGDWVKLDKDFIPNTIKDLKTFFASYCKKYLNENQKIASWNYEDYFLNAYKNMVSKIEYPEDDWF